MDERYLETIPEVESLCSRQSSVRHPTVLPDLPFRAVPPLNEEDTPELRRVSSIYSQISDQEMDEQDHTHAPQDAASRLSSKEEVSPISTPRSSIHVAPSEISLISPLDDSRFALPLIVPQSNQIFVSKIPRPVSPTPKILIAEPFAPVQPPHLLSNTTREETKWDSFSGEPSSNGKPAAIRPGAQPLELQYPQLKDKTRQILAGLRDRDSVKRSTWLKRGSTNSPDPLDEPDQKDPWKGASGRTTLVAPVKNNPGARTGPLQIPRRKVKQGGPVQVEDEEDTANSRVMDASPSEDSPLQQLPSATIRRISSREDMKTSTPLKINTSYISCESPASTEVADRPDDRMFSPQQPSPTFYQGVTVSSPTSFVDATPRMHYPAPVTTSAPVTPQMGTGSFVDRLRNAQYELQAQKNWTTPGAGAQQSPQPYTSYNPDESPIPPSTMPAPLTVKKRPVSLATGLALTTTLSAGQPRSASTVVSRKPVSAAKVRSISMSTTASMTKSLPPTPVELEAADKISSLEARLEDLTRRKTNTNKIIRELSSNLRLHGIDYGPRKRREVEKMLINLNLELDDITSQEHEVGVLLLRAQRKRDKEDSYEQPTGLWVRRIIS